MGPEATSAWSLPSAQHGTQYLGHTGAPETFLERETNSAIYATHNLILYPLTIAKYLQVI